MVSALLPTSLAGRFALTAAGLAAAAVLVTSLASWWLIRLQHETAMKELASKERQFYANAVGSQLQALIARISEVASSTILATGLVDSGGRETYLTPFLAGIRHVNGVPVQVLFTDFEGKEISSNGSAKFTDAQLDWMRRELRAGRASSAIFPAGESFELVALQPLLYVRTQSPEGGLLYKISLSDVHRGDTMRLEWGTNGNTEGSGPAPVAQVPVPALFEPLRFRVRGGELSASSTTRLAPQYLAILIIAVVVFTAVVLAGIRLARVLTRDLRLLEAFSSEFMSSGPSSGRPPVGGSDEVASLAAAINEMLNRLQEQHSALLNEQQKLGALAEALKEADQRKDEFLATLAHELRNPLAPIKNTVMVLKARPHADPQVAWARDVLDRQVNHMSRLLDDLLDVSRITRNKLELRKERVDLRHIIDAAVETSRPLIESARHKLTVELPSAPVYLQADPVRLAQVFANLLNNAAKYTPRDGHVMVSVRQDGVQALVSVKDNGLGIHSRQLPHIFDMFMQHTASRQHGHAEGGLGIGLSLVRSLIKMHDGEVSARSEGPGQGTEFVVRLPLSRVQGPAQSNRNGRHGDTTPLRPRRVLVVDDNNDSADSLGLLLRLEGQDVTIAYDGASALAHAEQDPPGIAFFDLGMPNMNGFELARRFRTHPTLNGVTLIALTGWGQQEDRERTRDAGFDDHLVKPVDAETLRRILG